jgi:hypothetical protein
MNQNTVLKISKMVCRICKLSGHYQKTCPMKMKTIAPVEHSDAPVQEITTVVSIPIPESESLVPAVAPVPAKQRKNVDFNICELVDAMMIVNYANISHWTITSAENIQEICQGWMDSQHIPSCIRLNDFTDLPKYMSDLTLKKACVSQRIIAFKELVVSTTSSASSASVSGFKLTDITCVYVSGKKNAHEKIHTLNAGLDIKQQKGDIYIEYATGEIIGWSCKQSAHATKSNYSVHKILGLMKELNQTKSTFLAENGFPKFSKDQRELVNQLFYPKNKNNAYWDAVRHAITNNKSVVIDALVKGLTGYTIPYSLYEFDGSSFHSLNTSTSSTTTSEVTFEEHANYYKMKNGEERSAAKLFYQLCISQKKYRVEIRWKGNVHDASPQFQIHDDADAHDDAEEKTVTVAVAAPHTTICEEGLSWLL